MEAKIELWATDRPQPYANNTRICPQVAIDKVAASIESFGFRQPILVDSDGVIIAGHTRLLAARQLKLAEVPVIVCHGLSNEKARLLRLADNRVAQETTWDPSMLSIEFAALDELNLNLEMTGFDSDELAVAMATPPAEGLTDPDAIPDVPEVPTTKPGDVWLCGAHRIACGDSTEPATVQRLMAGERAVGMFTDPPDLVDYDGGNHPQTWGKRGTTAEGKTKHWDAYTDHEQALSFYRDFMALALAEALSERPAIYQWFGMMRMGVVTEAWLANNVKLHQVVIWHKSRPVLGRCWFMWDYEPCAVGWIEGKQPVAKRRPPANARAVWPVDQKEGIEEGLGSVHPTIKPVEVVRRPIEWHTRPGELIYEPFSGSGTAIMAAQMTGRRCFALELSPAFCDVAVARWEAYTGEKATLEENDD